MGLRLGFLPILTSLLLLLVLLTTLLGQKDINKPRLISTAVTLNRAFISIYTIGSSYFSMLWIFTISASYYLLSIDPSFDNTGFKVLNVLSLISGLWSSLMFTFQAAFDYRFNTAFHMAFSVWFMMSTPLWMMFVLIQTIVYSVKYTAGVLACRISLTIATCVLGCCFGPLYGTGLAQAMDLEREKRRTRTTTAAAMKAEDAAPNTQQVYPPPIDDLRTVVGMDPEADSSGLRLAAVCEYVGVLVLIVFILSFYQELEGLQLEAYK